MTINLSPSSFIHQNEIHNDSLPPPPPPPSRPRPRRRRHRNRRDHHETHQHPLWEPIGYEWKSLSNNNSNDEQTFSYSTTFNSTINSFTSSSSSSSPSQDNCLIVFRLLVYILTTIVILGCGIFSKLLTLLIISMIGSNHRVPICNDINRSPYQIELVWNKSDHHQNHYNKKRESFPPILDPTHQYVAVYDTTTVQQYAWMWSLFLIIVAPLIFTFIRSLWICCFKSVQKPLFSTAMLMITIDCLHCFGLALLLFTILPSIDASNGAMLLSCTCLMPSIVRLFVQPQPQPQPSSSSSSSSVSSTTTATPKNYSIATTNTTMDTDFMIKIDDDNQDEDEDNDVEDIDENNNNNNIQPPLPLPPSQTIATTAKTTKTTNQNLNLSMATNRWINWTNFLLNLITLIFFTFIGWWQCWPKYFLLPFALIFVSLEHWENFLIPQHMNKRLQWFDMIRNDIQKCRPLVLCFTIPVKCLLILLMMMISVAINYNLDGIGHLFGNVWNAFHNRSIVVMRSSDDGDNDDPQQQIYSMTVDDNLWPLWLALIQIALTYTCYAFAKFSAKIHMQKISYTIPLALVMPITTYIVWCLGIRGEQHKCDLLRITPLFQYIYWNQNHSTLDSYHLNSDLTRFLLITLAPVLTLINFCFNSYHLWNPTNDRLASTDQLFVNPYYNATLLDVSLAFNRRCFTQTDIDVSIQNGGDPGAESIQNLRRQKQKVQNIVRNIQEEGRRCSLVMMTSTSGNNNNNNNNNLIDQLKQQQQQDDEVVDVDDNNDDHHQRNHRNENIDNFDVIKYDDNYIEHQRNKWLKYCKKYDIDPESIDAKPKYFQNFQFLSNYNNNANHQQQQSMINNANANLAINDDIIPRLYVCVTMWRESKEEMLGTIKSVIQLCLDQAYRRFEREKYFNTNLVEPYGKEYQLEVNIFFDDAFVTEKCDGDDATKPSRILNDKIIQLLQIIPKAIAIVLQIDDIILDDGYGDEIMLITPPTITTTPYGGKIIYHLPTRHKMIIHLKDCELVRNRKRWSQVMYMYHILGYRLNARQDLTEKRKFMLANNTYILTLDGDINFQPSAVHLVMDFMRKNVQLGSVCNRVHPLGDRGGDGGGQMFNPIVMYQKFEYAIGHWMQKSTEHVFGSVLCSPGCFSLLRARALMDSEVMQQYATLSTHAKHYLQYEQGEDRWLSTLLAKRGLSIEYCAASDAYTHVPSTLEQIYIQRRRWITSTLQNTVELLSDYRQVVEKNENISTLYILYQFVLLLGSLITPASIYLIIHSALREILHLNIGQWWLMMLDLPPIIAFTIVCLRWPECTDSSVINKHNSRVKLRFALVLSVIYTFLMITVLINTAFAIENQGALSSNAIFFFLMIFSFVLGAILHPHEWKNIFALPIYMLLMPSMYLFLIIYSLTNLNNVNWGTRDTVLDGGGGGENGGEQSNHQQQWSSFQQSIQNFFQQNDWSRCDTWFTCGGLFPCFKMFCCCSNQDSSSSSYGVTKLDNLERVIVQLQNQVTTLSCVKDNDNGNGDGDNSRQQQSVEIAAAAATISAASTTSAAAATMTTINEESIENVSNHNNTMNQQHEQESPPIDSSAATTIDDCDDHQQRSYWMTQINQSVKNFRFTPIQLHKREERFWQELIEQKRLSPKMEKSLDEQEKKRIKNELRQLRNHVCYVFAFLNAMFLMVMLLFEIHHDKLRFDFHIGALHINLDPIGFFLNLTFGTILVIQCFGMSKHVLSTFMQLIAHVELDFTDWFTMDEKESETFDSDSDDLDASVAAAAASASATTTTTNASASTLFRVGMEKLRKNLLRRKKRRYSITTISTIDTIATSTLDDTATTTTADDEEDETEETADNDSNNTDTNYETYNSIVNYFDVNQVLNSEYENMKKQQQQQSLIYSKQINNNNPVNDVPNTSTNTNVYLGHKRTSAASSLVMSIRDAFRPHKASLTGSIVSDTFLQQQPARQRQLSVRLPPPQPSSPRPPPTYFNLTQLNGDGGGGGSGDGSDNIEEIFTQF